MAVQHLAEAATAPAYDEIVRVIGLYIDGFNDHDVAKFKEAFHEDAWIFFNEADGTLRKYLLANCFDSWAAESDADIVGRILSVTQAGDIASVLLAFDYAGGSTRGWVDLHALLRINGVWKITNKTATHFTRAG